MILYRYGEETMIATGECKKIIPFEIERDSSNGLTFFVFPSLANFAEKFIREFSDDYFTDGAIAYVRETLNPFIQCHGYYEDKSSLKYYNEYTYDEKSIDLSFIKNSSSFIENSLPLCCTLLRPEIGRSAATVLNGKIVSLSVANFIDDGNTLEITTETIPEFRGKGYSTSNTAMLVQKLIADGKRIIYRCRCDNAASNSVAQKMGLKLNKIKYYYIGRKKDAF